MLNLHRETKGRATPQFTFNGNVAAHEVCQALGNSKAEATAHMLALVYLVMLGKTVEDCVHECLCHTGPRILDPASQNVSLAADLAAKGDADMSALCELDSVADEVLKDLLNSNCISLDSFGDRWVQFNLEGYVLGNLSGPKRFNPGQ